MFHLVFPQFLQAFPVFPLVILPVSYFRSYEFEIRILILQNRVLRSYEDFRFEGFRCADFC